MVHEAPGALVLDGEGEVKLALSAGEDEPLEIHLARVAPDDLRTVTFRSSIDDSIQRFAVRPARGDGSNWRTK